MGEIDVSVKHAISAFPAHWAELLGVRQGVPVRIVDSDLSTVVSVTDKVLRVEDDAPFLLHLEPQGYYDPLLDQRMHVYNALLRRRHRLFAHTTVLVLDRKAWGPANTGGIAEESPLGRCRLEFHYEVIKVWELAAGRILAGGTGILPLAPIADVPEAGVPDVIEQMAERLERELPRAEAAEFWTATLVLLGLKYDRAVARQFLQRIHDIMYASSTYQAIIEEGQAKAKRETLVLQGTRRFGAPDARTRSAIEAVTKLDRLDAMLLRVLDAAGWDDVLAAE